MKKILGIIAIWVCASGALFAAVSEEEQKGKGDVIVTIFSNLYSGFGAVNDERGFELDRAYIGYGYNFKNGLEIRAVMDFGQSKQVKDYHRIGFIKNAFAAWRHGKWELSGGLISTTQFKVQEDFWGKRYVMKSFQDEYKFGSSADLGVSAEYAVNDRLSLDVIVANGEGYKNLQVEDGLQYGAGATLRPCSGLTMRVYGSYNEAAEEGEKGVTNLAAFVGYQNRKVAVGGEYNHQLNTTFVKGQDASGTSLYATYYPSQRVNVFGRWDCLMSKRGWNEKNDGMNVLVGAEFRLGKFVKLAPNFRMWLPDAKNIGNRYYVYLNASFVL